MRLRARVLAAVLLAGAVGGVGVALERRPPDARGSGPVAQPGDGRTTSLWICPHGGGRGWRAWVSVVNAGAREVAIRVSTYGERGRVASEEGAVAAGSVRLVDVPAPAMAAGTIVESFGGRVAAGMGVSRTGGGMAAEPCLPEAGRTWYIAGGTAERGRGTFLVAVNPFATDAAFEVTLGGEGRVLQPGPLRGVVLPAGHAVAFDLNRFALGERAIGATVRVSLGRVAVASVGVDPAGLRSAVGVRSLARSWFLPGGAEDAAGSVGLVAGRREAPFRVSAQGAGTQEILTDVSVPPLRGASFDVAGAGSLLVAAEGRAPFAAARRVARPGLGDEAALSGAPTPSPAWVAPPLAPTEAGRLLVQNPGGGPASVTITLLGTSGPLPGEAERLELAPGRTEEIDLSQAATGLVAAVVRAERGEVVVGRSIAGTGGFALATAVPLRAI